MKTLSRRHFLKVSAASGATLQLAGCKTLTSAGGSNTGVFQHGVASGDPSKDRVIIWTRISNQSDNQVRWQVAKDKQFKHIVNSGIVSASSDKDYTVKVDVTGLKSGSTYYYRFKNSGVHSETGRTKTLPKGRLDKLNVVVVSCSNFPFGYFNAYEHIALDESVDIVLHLGDYIYEYGRDGWGAETGKTLGREHLPEHEIVSLQDYRQRHAQYKADSASRLMHAAHPLVPTWDDHESTNNPYMHGAQNHDASEGDWLARRDASVRAYYEWMPIREPETAKSQIQLWRHFEFGDLATLTTLETRHTGRAKQVEYSEYLADMSTQTDRNYFMAEVLGDQSRTMLSAEMQDFAVSHLADSKQKGVRWRLLGNQIPMARTHVPNIEGKFGSQDSQGLDPVAEELEQMMTLGKLDLPIYLDTWDGYGAAREAFYQACSNAGVQDLIVLTGDSHSFWTNQLFAGNGEGMGVEIGTAGVTSPGDFERLGPEGAAAFDQLLVEHNNEILWTSCQQRGYVKVSLTQDSAKTEYVAVDTVMSKNFSVEVIKSVEIQSGNDTLRFIDEF